MNISKIDEATYQAASRGGKQNGYGRKKTELSTRLDEMQAGDCIEVVCNNFEEFMSARNIIAVYKTKSRFGNGISYSASKKRLSIVVRRNA